MRIKENFLSFYSIRLTEVLSDMKGRDYAFRTPKVFKIEKELFFFEMRHYYGILTLDFKTFWNQKIQN